MDFQDALQIIGVSNVKDVEAIRREFAKKYNAVEDYSITTSSEKLKAKYIVALQTLELAYCQLMQLERIDDMRELLSFSKNPIVESHEEALNNIDPEMALLQFGIVGKMDPERLKSFYDEVVSEMTIEMNSFDLEASKSNLKREITFLESCYPIALNQLVQNNISHLIQSNPNTDKGKMKIWLVVTLIVLLVGAILLVKNFF